MKVRAILASVALVLALGACSAARSTGDGPSIPAGATQAASAPAKALTTATVAHCGVDAQFGIQVTAKGTLTNPKAGRQDVAVEAEALDASGQRVASLYGMASNVAPGQRVPWNAVSVDPLDKRPAVASCRVIGLTYLPSTS